MKSEINEKKVLLDFLKSGLSTRQLDRKLGFDSAKTKGWKSWKVLKKYRLKEEDRSKLFCFRRQESLRIIESIISLKSREEVEFILYSAEPQFFEKYKDLYILADTDLKVSILLSGEVRNITQSFFNPVKKVVCLCQFPKCSRTDLDTVHLSKSRPEHLSEACKYGRVLNTNKYDVYKILMKYINLHSKKKSLCFLCKKHHQELSSYEVTGGKKLSAFRKLIATDF